MFLVQPRSIYLADINANEDWNSSMLYPSNMQVIELYKQSRGNRKPSSGVSVGKSLITPHSGVFPFKGSVKERLQGTLLALSQGLDTVPRFKQLPSRAESLK